MNYVKLHVDALFAYRRLTDTEFGRAIRCVLQYVEDGTDPNLPGKEGIMYDVLREQVDRDREAYNKRVAAQTENGKKGGRPRKNAVQEQNPTEPNETQQNPWVFEKPNETQKTQEKEKEKENKSSPLPPSQGEDDDDDELLLIARRNDQVFEAARHAGFDLTGAVLDKLTDLISVHGPDAVERALASCVMHGAKSLAYLCKVLEGAPKPSSKPSTEELNGGYKPLWG